MKKKKFNFSLGILLTLSITIFVGTYVYSSYTNSKKPENQKITGLNPNKEPEASKLYNRIMSYDLDLDYPQTVEDVISLFNDTVLLLYGNMITDPEIEKSVLSQQRKLSSDDLLNGLSLDEQLLTLQVSLGILKEQGSICLGIEQKAIKYDPDDKDLCIVSIKNRYTGGLDVYRNYILYRDSDKNRWEVYSWEKTDENFNTNF